MQKFINQLVPFLLIGLAVVAFAFGIILLAHLFILGVIVGSVLYIIAWVKKRFFPTKTLVKRSQGGHRIIDADEWKRR